MLGLYTLLVPSKRVRKMAVITKPSTLLRLHQALVKHKYHILYGSNRLRRPGPKGPSSELIAAVVEMKGRNPRMGCRKIAAQISSAFGLAINKDVVRRILIQNYRPAPGCDGPSWLSIIGQVREAWCRMFNRAIARLRMPRHLSSDHDPLLLANLRILEIDEIKSIPGTPRSHAFIERLIGTIRREYLDQTLFWNQGDLERKLGSYKVYYNRYRCHTGLAGINPAQRSGAPAHSIADLDLYRWRKHCNGLFHTPAGP